jgi:hypothetical protein
MADLNSEEELVAQIDQALGTFAGVQRNDNQLQAAVAQAAAAAPAGDLQAGAGSLALTPGRRVILLHSCLEQYQHCMGEMLKLLPFILVSGGCAGYMRGRRGLPHCRLSSYAI